MKPFLMRKDIWEDIYITYIFTSFLVENFRKTAGKKFSLIRNINPLRVTKKYKN